MALKDFIALADDKLHEVFVKKAYDPQRDRAAMVKRLVKLIGRDVKKRCALPRPLRSTSAPPSLNISSRNSAMPFPATH